MSRRAGNAIFPVLIASLMVVPASAAPDPSVSRRTALCSAHSIKIMFVGTKVVVTSGAKTLAQASGTSRSISSSCRRINYRGKSRWSLTSDAGRRATLTCEGSFQNVVIETEQVGSGSRLAVWRGVLWSGGEMAEAVVGTSDPWLAYRPGACLRAG